MKVSVALLPHDRQLSLPTDVAVVVDVLRATSVMATALANGSGPVATFLSIEQAKGFAESSSPRPLLCGERQCRPIDGFDLGNSPREYSAVTVAGRPLAMTTTNGTRAIAAAQRANRVVAACFLNVAAVIEAIASVDHVRVICAGTDGDVTAEDVLLAGLIVTRCEQRFRADLESDEASIASGFWQSIQTTGTEPNPETIAQHLRQTRGGRNLIRFGYADDISICSQLDSLDTVPEQVTASPPTFQPA